MTTKSPGFIRYDLNKSYVCKWTLIHNIVLIVYLVLQECIKISKCSDDPLLSMIEENQLAFICERMVCLPVNPFQYRFGLCA